MINGLGVEYNRDNKLVYELTRVYGLGFNVSLSICSKFGLSPYCYVKEVPKYLFDSLILFIKREYSVNTELRSIEMERIRTERGSKSYRAMRRLLRLPLNGQRTKTNAKTVKKVL